MPASDSRTSNDAGNGLASSEAVTSPSSGNSAPKRARASSFVTTVTDAATPLLSMTWRIAVRSASVTTSSR